MTSYSAVIPLLHTECKLIRYAPILLDDTISVRVRLTPTTWVRFLMRRRSLAEKINPHLKCILVEAGDEGLPKDNLEEIALSGTFALNVFSKLGAIVYEHAFVLRRAKRCSVQNILDFSSYTPPTLGKFEMVEAAKPDAIRLVFKDTMLSLAKDKALKISIRKFNSAIAKTNDEDRLIDISICLESI